jgi:hypothetical protein
MRSKTFRKKHGKMSRRRRAGQPNGLTRTTTAELNNMEEGNTVATRPMLGRTTTAEMSRMEEGYAPTAPPIELMDEPEQAPAPTLGRSSSAELHAMETGTADVEAGFGKGGKKKRTRKGRKGRKTRKGRRKSHRR